MDSYIKMGGNSRTDGGRKRDILRPPSVLEWPLSSVLLKDGRRTEVDSTQGPTEDATFASFRILRPLEHRQIGMH